MINIYFFLQILRFLNFENLSIELGYRQLFGSSGKTLFRQWQMFLHMKCRNSWRHVKSSADIQVQFSINSEVILIVTNVSYYREFSQWNLSNFLLIIVKTNERKK